MRTGAIFARGSCRALKWMALFGVVFVLGAGQAFAQAPVFSTTATEHEFEPGTTTITLTMDQTVYGSPPASLFTVMVDADGTGPGAAAANAVTAVSPISQSSPSTKVTLTVTTAIKTGSTATVAYDAPATATAAQLKASDDDAAVEDTTAFEITEGESIPSLPDVEDMTLVLNDRVTAIALPDATGGNGARTYTLNLEASTATGVTAHAINTAAPTGGSADTGLRFLADPPTILGTPSVKGVHNLRYAVADSAVGNGTANTISQTFKITVEGEDFTPTDGVKVATKSVTAAATVAEGGVLDVTVTATVPAGEEVGGKVAPVASRKVMVTFPATDAKIMVSERAEPNDFELLGADGDDYYTWKNIKRTDKASEQTFKFRVDIDRDVDAEDEKFQIEVKIGDEPSKKSKVLMIDDAETQKYTLTLPSAAKGAITEGAEDATTLTLKADPKRTMNIPVYMALDPNDPAKYSLTFTDDGMFGKDKASVTATIKAMADKNRANDKVTVTAYTDGSLGNRMKLEGASVEITVKDANALPGVRARVLDEDGDALNPQPTSVMEGMTYKIMLTAVDEDGDSMKAAEKLSISLMAAGTADAQDYRLSGHPVEIASGKESSAAVELMVLSNDDLGEEMLTFDAVVSGEEKNGPGTNPVMGVLSLMIEDSTQKLVWARTQKEVEDAVYAAKNAGMGDDKMLNPGEMIEIMGSALFDKADGVSLSFTAGSDNMDVATTAVSGDGVMVTAGNTAGVMAHITITAHASMSGVQIVDQTDPTEASIMFPVEVGLEALSIMLSGPEDMNVAEGMSATVTAMANRAVTEDVTVMLMRDRAMSSAEDADFTAEAITIEAGEMSGMTMVMAVEDSMAEDMEELVLYGMAADNAGEVTGEVKLYLWDAAVPALPIIAQLLLAALLGVGGYRRYLRRR